MRRLCLVLSTAVVLSLAPMGAQTASAAPAEREMRAATVFVARLRHGGADLAFLARDVAALAPRPP